MTIESAADTCHLMKVSSWILAAGAIACLVAAYLVVAPLARDQLLQFARVWRERNEGADLAERLVSTDNLLDYFAAHPDQVALASWEVGDESNGIYFNAHRPQPDVTGGTLLVLAAYADQLVGEGLGQEVIVPLESWERYWLPGTDRGSHQAALHEARTYGTLVPIESQKAAAQSAAAGSAGPVEAAEAAEATITTAARLNDVVRAMVRYGDPAATDLLIERLGRTRLSEEVRRLGFAADTVPLPSSGMQLSFMVGAPAPELLARYRVMKRGAYVDLTWDWFSRLRHDDALRTASLQRLEREGVTLSLREAADLNAALLPRGTARGYARLMQQIASGQDPSSEYMRAHLDWPVSGVGTRDEFAAFGSVAGAQPGVTMTVTYGRAKGASGTRVLALMLRRLPIGVWLHLSSSLVLKRFEAELLADETFFVRVKDRLEGASRASTSSASAAQRARVSGAPSGRQDAVRVRAGQIVTR